jgi:hypothetical protein
MKPIDDQSIYRAATLAGMSDQAACKKNPVAGCNGTVLVDSL